MARSLDGDRTVLVALRAAQRLDPGSLPPEQASGGRPRPLGDVYALGATLAFAAAGHTAPERDELPVSIRSLIGRCLSRDPGTRPHPAELPDEFAPESQTSTSGFQTS